MHGPTLDFASRSGSSLEFAVGILRNSTKRLFLAAEWGAKSQGLPAISVKTNRQVNEGRRG